MKEFSAKEFYLGIEHVLVWKRSLIYTELVYYTTFKTDGILLKRIKLHRSEVKTRFFQLTDEEVESMILPRII